MHDDPRSQIYRHKKTGGLYTVLHWDAKIEGTMDEAVVYQSLEHGMIWVRPKAEFMDGRFECIPRVAINHFVGGYAASFVTKSTD